MASDQAEQLAAALVGVHLLAAALVVALVVAASRLHRYWIRLNQGLRVRIALAMWLTQSSALAPREDGHTTTGAGTPDPAPVVVLPRRRVDWWTDQPAGRHRAAA